jgi:hypothetical protein
MLISEKWRGILYIALAVIAVVLAVVVVFLGVITSDQVLKAVEVAALIYAAFIGLLARVNLSPDVPPK